MSEYTIWWIDDQEDREDKHAQPLEEHGSSISVVFSDPTDAAEILHEEAFTDELRDPEGEPDIDLVLIDWILNQEGDFLGKGLTMAGSVREHLFDIPIYGFTGGSASDLEDMRARTSDPHFQGTFKLTDLSSRDGAELLENDLQDYATIEDTRGAGFQALLDTLKPPDDVIEEMVSVVPREFGGGLRTNHNEDGGSRLEFADWVRQRFLTTPGPLWDDTWTATKLGIDHGSFDMYAQRLNGTEYGDIIYEGVFSHRTERRWWSSQVIAALVSLVKNQDQPLGEIKKDAPKILKAQDHKATCSVCEEDYPDIVAAAVEGEDAVYPVHYHCSHVHHTREGAFEDYRIADKLE